jgi:hypothetical protein
LRGNPPQEIFDFKTLMLEAMPDYKKKQYAILMDQFDPDNENIYRKSLNKDLQFNKMIKQLAK